MDLPATVLAAVPAAGGGPCAHQLLLAEGLLLANHLHLSATQGNSRRGRQRESSSMCSRGLKAAGQSTHASLKAGSHLSNDALGPERDGDAEQIGQPLQTGEGRGTRAQADQAGQRGQPADAGRDTQRPGQNTPHGSLPTRPAQQPHNSCSSASFPTWADCPTMSALRRPFTKILERTCTAAGVRGFARKQARG